jgi:hypothetical protein
MLHHVVKLKRAHDAVLPWAPVGKSITFRRVAVEVRWPPESVIIGLEPRSGVTSSEAISNEQPILSGRECRSA